MNSAQYDRLPQYAKDYIEQLKSERDQAVEVLNRHIDQQTDSPFSYEEHPCLGEGRGCEPTFKKFYVQTNHITVVYEGIEVTVLLRPLEGIEVMWSSTKRAMGDVVTRLHNNRITVVPTKFGRLTP